MAMKDLFPPTELSEKVSTDLIALELNPEPRAPCLVAIDVLHVNVRPQDRCRNRRSPRLLGRG